MEIVKCSFDFISNGNPFKIVVNGEMPNLVHTCEFRPSSTNKNDLVSVIYKIEAPEFFDDVQRILRLFDKPYKDDQNILLEVLKEICLTHIEKFNRMLIADLETYIDELLIVLKHFQLAHGNQLSIEEGNEMWIMLRKSALIILKGQVWAPSPFNPNQIIKL